jgi:hypothetical protein
MIPNAKRNVSEREGSGKVVAIGVQRARSRQARQHARLRLNPPDNAVVLSVDEKTSIQALERTQLPLPLRTGRAMGHTHDYKRHGVATCTPLGRGVKPPPQLGQTSLRTSSTQEEQKVHSKLQNMASVHSGGRGSLQCSHEGRSSSISDSARGSCFRR